MGLDMYLSRTAKCQGVDYGALYEKEITSMDDIPKELQKYASPWWEGSNLINPFEQYAYWRKFNALHGWFVQNIQDGVDKCQLSRPIEREEFEELLKLLEGRRLEPVKGFFFGSTEKGKWYEKEVVETIEVVKKILSEVDFDKEILIYHSSW